MGTSTGSDWLTLPAQCSSGNCIKMKINLNFYFHASLWCLSRFYEGLEGLQGFEIKVSGIRRSLKKNKH